MLSKHCIFFFIGDDGVRIDTKNTTQPQLHFLLSPLTEEKYGAVIHEALQSALCQEGDAHPYGGS